MQSGKNRVLSAFDYGGSMPQYTVLKSLLRTAQLDVKQGGHERL
jgi:hypothetical protein